jgi:tripeptide aminopeptidase
MTAAVDTTAAIERLMRFLAVEGVTGQEAAISREIQAALKEGGVPASAITTDDAHTRIPLPTQCGNLIVKLPGTRPAATPVLYMTHMDTVPLCAGAKPVRSDRRITNAANTALGGDNRTGCAVLVTLAAELVRQKLPAPDPPVHGPRGERPVRREARQPGGPAARRRGPAHGVQLRRPAGG